MTSLKKNVIHASFKSSPRSNWISRCLRWYVLKKVYGQSGTRTRDVLTDTGTEATLWLKATDETCYRIWTSVNNYEMVERNVFTQETLSNSINQLNKITRSLLWIILEIWLSRWYFIKLLCPLKTKLEINLGLVILPNCRLQIIGKRNLMSSYKVSSLDRLLVLRASIG